MRGSLMVYFDEGQVQLGTSGYQVTVNGQLRYTHYWNANNLYSTFLYVGDVIKIDFINITGLTLNTSVLRIDYTTDDVNGDRGIKNTLITNVDNPSSNSYQFTATTLNTSYDFEYRFSGVKPSITPTVTPTNTLTPTVTPSITPTNSLTPTITPTVTPTNSLTPTVTPTPTITPTITVTPTSTQIPPIVTSGLTFYLDAGNPASYPGSGNIWYDLTANNNDFTAVNGASYSSTNGGAMFFDGINDYFDGPNLSVNTGFTIEAWFYTDSINIQNIVGQSQTGGLFFGTDGRTLGVFDDNTRLRITGQNNVPWSSVFYYNTTIFSNWNYYSATYDNNNLKIYLNGNLVLTTPKTGTFDSEKFIIGGSPYVSPNKEFFRGYIPIARLYNRTLNSSEIYNNYYNEQSRFVIEPTPTVTPTVTATPTATPVTPTPTATPVTPTPTQTVTPTLIGPQIKYDVYWVNAPSGTRTYTNLKGRVNSTGSGTVGPQYSRSNFSINSTGDGSSLGNYQLLSTAAVGTNIDVTIEMSFCKTSPIANLTKRVYELINVTQGITYTKTVFGSYYPVCPIVNGVMVTWNGVNVYSGDLLIAQQTHYFQ